MKEVAQLVFAIPDSIGGGTYQKGQPILVKNIKPRVIYIVYSGSVRECIQFEDMKQKPNSTMGEEISEAEDIFTSMSSQQFSQSDEDNLASSGIESSSKRLNSDLSSQKTTSYHSIDDKVQAGPLGVGSVLALNAVKDCNMITKDYIAAQNGTQVLCINGFDYFIAYDKYLVQEAKILAKLLEKVLALENWGTAKFDSFSLCFKPRRHLKDDVVLENGSDVDQIIYVRKGKLRLQKNMTYALQNVWPNNEKNGYYAHNAVNDEELTVSTVGEGFFIGLQQVHQNKPFKYGTLIVDEDETILSFIDRRDFLR